MPRGYECGSCNIAREVLSGWIGQNIPAWAWLNRCKYGGCVPELWDFFDDDGNLLSELRPNVMIGEYHPDDWVIKAQEGRLAGKPDPDYLPGGPKYHANRQIRRTPRRTPPPTDDGWDTVV